MAEVAPRDPTASVAPADRLVEVRDLAKHFPVTGGIFGREIGVIKALDGVDLTIRTGETLGLVGESGCGKTTLGRTILLLQKPTRGDVLFQGQRINDLDGEALRALRREMQLIFQDPYSSLNPRKTVGSTIAEPFVIHGIGSMRERRERALELLSLVGLRAEHLDRYPHEFSGGQRQRIGIARALALNPKLVVCDEPVSALDVSIQSQVINLLNGLQQRFGLTYLFVTHDLGVVEHVSDRVAVMYLGRIVEISDSEALYRKPLHPYSRALLSASPVADPTVIRQRVILQGDIPSPANPPPGCHFHTRCPYATDLCREEPAPELEEIAPDRFVRCWRVADLPGD